MSDVSKISEIAKHWKEIFGLLGLVISMGLSTYTWVTTKFAMKEYVDYNNCYLEKRLQGSDYTTKIYFLNSELRVKQDEYAMWEFKFRGKSVPLAEMNTFRRMNDDISKIQSDIKEFELKKKVQDDRDCLKEARNTH